MQKKALLIVDHGSKIQAANAQLADVVSLVRQLQPELLIGFAHMELAEPTIESALEDLKAKGAKHIVVHPYMLSPGRHATEDIPRIATEAGKKLDLQIEVTLPLGLHLKIAEVVLERASLDDAK